MSTDNERQHTFFLICGSSSLLLHILLHFSFWQTRIVLQILIIFQTQLVRCSRWVTVLWLHVIFLPVTGTNSSNVWLGWVIVSVFSLFVCTFAIILDWTLCFEFNRAPFRVSSRHSLSLTLMETLSYKSVLEVHLVSFFMQPNNVWRTLNVNENLWT